ncbi:MAG: hypothetical protein Q8L20_11115 [Gammaproteobacteria bacterium]|nr:hypothetical protein [Gammaproteobacteria bacterium]
MQIVPLQEYARLRRSTERKAACSWARDAKAGRIWGAFRYHPTGPWFVDLDIHDEEVRKMATYRPVKKPANEDLPPDFLKLAAEMGLDLTSEDLQVAARAARA